MSKSNNVNKTIEVVKSSITLKAYQEMLREGVDQLVEKIQNDQNIGNNKTNIPSIPSSNTQLVEAPETLNKNKQSNNIQP